MPPFPYGPAPAWVFPIAELTVYLFFLLCLAHALKRHRYGAVSYLFGGLLFGVLLELFEVLGHSYTYGHFWVMVGRSPLDVPLWVACAWAIILYTSRLFSDALRLSWPTAACLDALLALNIDLSIDVIAYRLHMWHWEDVWRQAHLNPLTAQWFGIPYGNFVGWITVVFGYSFFCRFFERLVLGRDRALHTPPRPWQFPLTVLLGFFAALALLVSTETWIFPLAGRIGLHSGLRFLLCTLALAAFALYGYLRAPKPALPIPSLATAVPAYFHLYFIALFLVFGFFRENKWMTLAAAINATLGIALHLLPLHRSHATTARANINRDNF
jgi:hypothetical protein